MATPAEVQTALGTNPLNARIQRAYQTLSDATKCAYYVVGNVDARGRDRWCVCTVSDNAATQAASILTQLRAS